MISRALVAGCALMVGAALGAAQDVGGRDLVPNRVQILVPQRPIVQPSGQAAVQISAAHVKVFIRDRVARTELAITVSNPGPRTAEAQLILPVPDGSAIGSFGLDSLGDDASAVLLPAAEARRIYDDIVRKMIDPGLLEFAGLGLIRSSVFPVEGGKTQTFRVSYEQVLPAHAGRIDYVLPRTEALGATGVEWTIEVEIENGSALGPVFSPSHPIEVTPDGRTKARVVVQAPNDPGSFRLGVVDQSAGDGAMTVIAYPDARVADGKGGYFMLVGGAREEWAQQTDLDREVTLVIDRSGSMRGEKLAQAKEAALQVLEGLEPGELFNIIDYSGGVERFAERPQAKTAETLAQARAYIKALESGGSTNLHDALVASLRQPARPGVLPLVLFLTDGKATDGVTSEVGIREAAKAANEHGRRVFTFGVGFDLNAPLLTGLAEETRAVPTFVLPEDNIEVKVSQVFDRLDGPLLVNPKVTAVLTDIMPAQRRAMVRDLQPSRLPDLFEGDQLIVLGRYTTDEPMAFELSGFVSDEAGAPGLLVQMTFDPKDASVRNAYVPRLWAQRRIAELTAQIRQAGASGSDPDSELVKEIIALSTEHGILTEFTSFLAAEETQFAASGAMTRLDALQSQVEIASEAYEFAAVQDRVGRGAVAQELNNRELKMGVVLHQNTFADAAAPAPSARVSFAERRINTVQRANDQTLFQRAGNRWVDARALERETDEPDQTVEFGTDAYFALVDDLVVQNRQGLIANRGEVLLLNRGQLVLVKNPS